LNTTCDLTSHYSTKLQSNHSRASNKPQSNAYSHVLTSRINTNDHFCQFAQSIRNGSEIKDPAFIRTPQDTAQFASLEQIAKLI
jgi:hypothetical protein